EAVVLDGELFPASGRSAVPFAEALARLVALAPDPQEVPSLDPPLPWTAPDKTEQQLWRWPDDCDIDLNTVGGPAWIDAAGQAARDRLSQSELPLVLGHGDWYTGNL